MGGASIIGIVNQKGGTGKTTSCVNLGVDLAHEGKRVWDIRSRICFR